MSKKKLKKDAVEEVYDSFMAPDSWLHWTSAAHPLEVKNEIPNFQIRSSRGYNKFVEKTVYCRSCNDMVVINTNFPECVFCGLFLGEHIGLELVPVTEEEKKASIDIQINHLIDGEKI